MVEPLRPRVEGPKDEPSETEERPASLLDPYRTLVAEKIEDGLTITRILREITEEGYAGGRTILAEYVRTLEPAQVPRRERPKRRFETPPAIEMQADFGTYLVSIGGVTVVVHAFVCTLGYSRKVYVEVFRHQRQSSVFEGLEGAHHDFEGAAHRTVVDNITSIILGRTEVEPGKRKPIFHPNAILFEKHYGSDFYPARPYDPDRKGKTENGVGFFERDFIRGSRFESWDDLRRRVREWCQRVNKRVHGTTGRVPDEAWQEERPLLVPLPAARFAVHQTEPRAVGPDSTLERDHPPPEPELPLCPLGGAGPALLGDVDEGSLDRFEALDQAQDTESEGEAADGA